VLEKDKYYVYSFEINERLIFFCYYSTFISRRSKKETVLIEGRVYRFCQVSTHLSENKVDMPKNFFFFLFFSYIDPDILSEKDLFVHIFESSDSHFNCFYLDLMMLIHNQ